MERSFRALRGAIDAVADSVPAIEAATKRLFSALLERNSLGAGDIVSVIISVTDDLHAINPATVVRAMGHDGLALMCLKEADFEGGLPRVIRMIVHCTTDAAPEHVYLGGARALRPDLADPGS